MSERAAKQATESEKERESDRAPMTSACDCVCMCVCGCMCMSVLALFHSVANSAAVTECSKNEKSIKYAIRFKFKCYSRLHTIFIIFI